MGKRSEQHHEFSKVSSLQRANDLLDRLERRLRKEGEKRNKEGKGSVMLRGNRG